MIITDSAVEKRISPWDKTTSTIPVTTKMVTICFTAAQISKKNTTRQLAKGTLYIPKGCEATYTVDKNCGMFSEIKEG